MNEEDKKKLLELEGVTEETLRNLSGNKGDDDDGEQ